MVECNNTKCLFAGNCQTNGPRCTSKFQSTCGIGCHREFSTLSESRRGLGCGGRWACHSYQDRDNENRNEAHFLPCVTHPELGILCGKWKAESMSASADLRSVPSEWAGKLPEDFPILRPQSTSQKVKCRTLPPFNTRFVSLGNSCAWPPLPMSLGGPPQ